MSVPPQSIIDTRRHQMFPVLEPAEAERVRRFGKVRSYGVGAALAKVGEVGLGLTIILAGKVNITQHDQSGRRTPIVSYGVGAFMGELAQLAGRPTLVDAHAQEPVEALIIPPDQLRALLSSRVARPERLIALHRLFQIADNQPSDTVEHTDHGTLSDSGATALAWPTLTKLKRISVILDRITLALSRRTA
jgi:CRP-like cAMP-binding protein